MQAKARPKANARWLELAAEFPLRPIRSETQLDKAIALVDRLTDRKKLTAEELDYRDALADLIADYEDEHEPEPPPDPAGMLRYLLDTRGVSPQQAAEGSGVSEATLSQILSGKKTPSHKAIAALSRYFQVDPRVFL